MTTRVYASRAARAAAALLVLALVLRVGQGRHGAAVVADPLRTPGVVNPAVTQATVRSTICRRGWTATIRPPVEYTNALKRKQMRAYGETGPPSAYQEDHLVSLELGGDPSDPRNLWPEPYPRASAVADRERAEREGLLRFAHAPRGAGRGGCAEAP